MLQQELETAIELARKAETLILKYYETGFETEEKIGVDDHSEPVTIADREASRIIVEGLAAAFRDDAILSEEEADDAAKRLSRERVWIIDPIDGTAGFVKHDGDFAVQIGLAIDGDPHLGVVLLPHHGTITYAVKGGGTFVVNGSGSPIRLSVSQKTDFHHMAIAVSRNHLSNRMHRILDHFRFADIKRRGSVGLKAGLIADQTCDVYIHPSPRTKLWDTCAPEIILEEAGGRLTDLFGNKIEYDQADLQNHNGIVATNGTAHDAVLTHLEPILKEFGRVPHGHK